jgi:hypothetical protein
MRGTADERCIVCNRNTSGRLSYWCYKPDWPELPAIGPFCGGCMVPCEATDRVLDEHEHKFTERGEEA